jgi:hypothetical protein
VWNQGSSAARIKNETSNVKRRIMKKYAKILATFVFLAGYGITANAEIRDEILVRLPFQFVVGGKTLPAGTYRVTALSSDNSGPLTLTSRENGTSVFVLPYMSDYVSADKPHVDFQQIGEERFLTTIQTTEETFFIPVSHSIIMEATAKLHNSVSASGSSGNE